MRGAHGGCRHRRGSFDWVVEGVSAPARAASPVLSTAGFAAMEFNRSVDWSDALPSLRLALARIQREFGVPWERRRVLELGSPTPRRLLDHAAAGVRDYTFLTPPFATGVSAQGLERLASRWPSFDFLIGTAAALTELGRTFDWIEYFGDGHWLGGGPPPHEPIAELAPLVATHGVLLLTLAGPKRGWASWDSQLRRAGLTPCARQSLTASLELVASYRHAEARRHRPAA